MIRRMSSSWIVGAVAVGLGLGLAPQAPVEGVRHARVVTRTDLDTFSDEQLDRDLQDELDDVFMEHAPNAVADVATIEEAIMEALSDEGDDGPESEISLADLEDEMHEDGTNVKDVVHDAVARLDRAAVDRPTIHLAAWRGASEPGQKPSYGLAVRDAKRSLIREIRKAR